MQILEVELPGINQRRQALKRPLPEAQIATLREVNAAYQARCPFKVGDIVTPKPTAIYQHIGVPHVVLEVAAVPIRDFEPGSCTAITYGCKLDIRVGVLIGESVAAYWQESWQHEFYSAE